MYKSFSLYIREELPWLLPALLLVVSLLCAPWFQAQDDGSSRIPSELVGKSLKVVFRYMETEFELEFAYDVALIKDKTCQSQYHFYDPQELLTKILSPYELNYRRSGKTYLIIPAIEWKKTMETGEISKTNFSVTGQIMDKNSGSPLPFAFVSVKNTRIWAESNVDGYFRISNIPNDTMLLSVNYLGHNLYLKRLNQLEHQDVKIALHLFNYSLSQVDIVINKISVIAMDRHSGFQQIDPGQIDLISGNGQSDVFKGLQLMSGVQTEDASSAALSIRNSGEDENLVLLDGIPLYHLSHFFGIYSTVNPDMMKSIRLYKSTFGVEYGGKIGGVVDMVAKEGNSTNMGMAISFNLISGGILLETPIVKNKTTLMLGFRKSYTNQFKSGLYKNLLNINFKQGLRGDEFLAEQSVDANASLSFYDANVKIKHQFDESLKLTFSLMQATDQYDNTLLREIEGNNIGQQFEKESFDDSRWGSLAMGISLNKQWSDEHHSMLQVSRSIYNSQYDYNDRIDEFQFDNLVESRKVNGSTENRLLDLSVAISSQQALNDKHVLKYGVGYRWFDQKNKESIAFPDQPILNNTNLNISDNGLLGLYLSDDYKINSSWMVTGGVRMESYDRNSIYLLPRAKIHVDLNDHWSLNVSGGRYNQYVRRVAKESLALNQSDDWRLVGDEIPIAKSDQANMALFYQHDDWKFQLETYVKSNTGTLINRGADSLFTLDPSLSSRYLIGNTEITGMEVTVTKNYNNHAAWLAYSLSQALNYFDQINNGEAFSAKNNRLHDFKLNYQFRINRWSLSSSYVYATGKSYTPILGTFTNELTGANFAVYGDEFSVRLPSYSRLDVGVKYNMKIRKNVLRIGVGVYNVLNHKNITQRTYNVYQLGSEIDAPLQIDILDLEVLGISPNFSISYRIL